MTITSLLDEYDNLKISTEVLETIKNLAEQDNTSAKHGFLDFDKKSSNVLQRNYATVFQKIKKEIKKISAKDVMKWN